MTELKLFALHFGMSFFAWFLLILMSGMESKDIDFKRLAFAIILVALASFAIHWGLIE